MIQIIKLINRAILILDKINYRFEISYILRNKNHNDKTNLEIIIHFEI